MTLLQALSLPAWQAVLGITGLLLLIGFGASFWAARHTRFALERRIGEAEAAAARHAASEQQRLETLEKALLAQLAQLAIALETLSQQTASTPIIHDDTRKTLVKLKQMADGINTLRSDIASVGDEVSTQSAAKFQANEIIRAALTRGGSGS